MVNQINVTFPSIPVMQWVCNVGQAATTPIRSLININVQALWMIAMANIFCSLSLDIKLLFGFQDLTSELCISVECLVHYNLRIKFYYIYVASW